MCVCGLLIQFSCQLDFKILLLTWWKDELVAKSAVDLGTSLKYVHIVTHKDTFMTEFCGIINRC